MKTFILFILIVWINVFFAVSQTSLLDRIVKIEHQQVTLASALDEIGNKGGFTFSYGQDIPRDKIVTLLYAEQTVRQYLDEVFPDGIYSIQFGNKLIIMQKPALANTYALRGKVINRETKDPIPGVTVYIPGSVPLIGAVTNEEGVFEFRTPLDVNMIQISCIGYETKSLRPGKSTAFTVELNPDNLELEEVVITYYRKPKEERINSAVSGISTRQLENMQVGGVEQTLQGNTSGVNVVRNSGIPGASLQVKIRGINSLINSDPVYYIDGVPIQQTSLYTLSPYDIESIEVLKDGASLARYGARAGNGVVLFNTKKGDQKKTRIAFDFFIGRQELWKKLELMNKDEFMDYYRLVRPTTNNYLVKTLDSIYNTDWQNVTFHRARTEEYHVTLSGGNKKSDFYVSSGYYRQQAIIKNLQLDRYSFRVNSNHRIKSRIQFGQDLSFSYLHYKGLKEGCFMNDYNNPILGALIMAPYKSRDDSTGTVISSDNFVSDPNFSNPNSNLTIERNSRKNYALFNRLNAIVKLLPNLNYITRLGLDVYFQDNISYVSSLPSILTSKNISEYTYHIIDLAFDWQHTLQYTASISKNHRLDVMIDFEYGRNKCQWIPVTHKTYDETLSYLTDTTHYGQESYEKLQSSTDFICRDYAVSLAYSYKDKLYADALLRRDEVGFYDVQHHFRECSEYFPSLSLGWIFTRENLFPVIKVLSYGKLRYGWGKAGNSPRINYTFFARMMQDMEYVYAFNSERYITYTATCRRTNEHFYWENIQSHNAGLDLGFFQNKLFFSADYFYSELNEGEKYGVEKPKEIIEKINLMYYYGIYYLPLSNMQNKGFELELSYRHGGRALNWNLNINFSHVTNRILDVNESERIAWNIRDGLEPLSINLPGEVAGSFYGYKIEHLFRSDDCDEKGWATNQPYTLDAEGKKIYAQPYAKAGDYKFTDRNNDGVIDKDDRAVLGNPIPDFTFGLFCQMDWKNIDFSMLIQGIYGNEIFNATRLYLYNPYGQSNWTKDVVNSYRPPKYSETGELIDAGVTNTNLHRLDFFNINRNLRVSDFYIEDGSYLRLKNIQLGYTIQPEFTKRFHIQRFRIFIGSQNLLTFTRYSGLDPEVGGWGIDCGQYPQTRVYMVGANVEF
jgi:TonB-dependent starch-binding outer membrane protein SusC